MDGPINLTNQEHVLDYEVPFAGHCNLCTNASPKPFSCLKLTLYIYFIQILLCNVGAELLLPSSN